MKRCVDCGNEFELPIRGRNRKRCFACSPSKSASIVAPRACEQCHETFPPANKRARFCSEMCRVDWRRETGYRSPSARGECSDCGKTIWVGRSSSKNPRCRDCRNALVKCGTLAMYDNRGCRCAECRAAKARAMREYHRTYRETRTCEECSSPFEAQKNKPTRFCTSTCFARSRRACKDGRSRHEVRNTRRRAIARRKKFERLIAKAAIGTTGGGRVWVQGDCLVCGESFPPSPGAASRYCSRGCRAVARNSRDWISFEDRRQIYLRDGWTCQICLESTSKRWDSSDPWSPTLDHIVPRSRGGSDDPSNLRLAHAWCNSVRGDGSFYSDEDLRAVV